MERLAWRELVTPDARVAVKLNLSSVREDTLRCSNTDPRLTAAVCRVLQERTKNITLVESDGMRYSASEAFEMNGVYSLAEEIGVKVCNLSAMDVRTGLDPLLEDFGLSTLLLEETDVFITLPVLKTHALTVFTGALKNQWGCVPKYDRILLHKNLDELLPLINRLYRTRLAIMDGMWCTEGRGPTSGKERYLGALLGSRHLASLDATAMRLVGLLPSSSRHVVLGEDQGLGPIAQDCIEVIGPFDALKTEFEPAVLDWAVDYMNRATRSRFFVHKILLNGLLFSTARRVVQVGRRIGLVR